MHQVRCLYAKVQTLVFAGEFDWICKLSQGLKRSKKLPKIAHEIIGDFETILNHCFTNVNHAYARFTQRNKSR